MTVTQEKKPAEKQNPPIKTIFALGDSKGQKVPK